MPVATTLKRLDPQQAFAAVDEGAALVDLRPIDDYLDVHIPGSIELLYEFGPGMAGRAYDCLPRDMPLVLLDLGMGDMTHAAASLRGKGFAVLGCVADALNAWAAEHGTPASTDVLRGDERPTGLILDVGDPGVRAPDDATRIPAESLYDRVGELRDADAVVVAAGYGVRAALAVGILERAGIENVAFWKTRGR